MQQFKHDYLPKIDLKRGYVNGERRYYANGTDTPYVSVTTALSRLTKPIIDEWKRNVGEDVAAEISKRAAKNGTEIHTLAELYLCNDDSWKRAMPISLSRFMKIQPIIRDNVGTIHGVEHRLYSDELVAAGTADLICEWDGRKTVADFKTSMRVKSKKDCLTYFLQCASYAIMLQERYDYHVERLVLVIAVNEDYPIYFNERADKYIPIARKFFEMYHQGKIK